MDVESRRLSMARLDHFGRRSYLRGCVGQCSLGRFGVGRSRPDCGIFWV